MQKVALLTKKLEVSLGPGTGDLRMRFGLHSGPGECDLCRFRRAMPYLMVSFLLIVCSVSTVTAGVLRGEKSRFQLFGDTVNTASRVRSTPIN